MGTTAATQRRHNNGFLLSRAELVAQMYDHSEAFKRTPPNLIRAGLLDVALLQRAELHVPEALLHHPVVEVSFCSMTYNSFLNRSEAIFAVRHDGEFLGHYFANAFKTLV